MTYTETLEFLFSRLPMFSRTGASAIKPSLANTLDLCRWLDNPQEKFRSVHVAGTNGKGSTSHMLAAILQVCGYKTGLYTSPHLKDFRERIRVNGEMVSEEFVVGFTQKALTKIDEISPSFFELSVAMAFEYFRQQEIDIAVIETGLGGRLDSTNVITPEISVITNIGLDHMNILGNTAELIAAEKAGIIKDRVKVVIGESSLETEEVFLATAAERHAPIVFADKKWYVSDWHHQQGYLVTNIVNNHDGSRETFQLDLPGYYQLKNLVTVTETVHQLRSQGFDLPREKVAKALTQVKKLTGLHGRWDIVHRNPSVVLDVAHNADGISQLMKQVELADYHELHVIMGIVKDKEIGPMLQQMPKEAKYYFTRADIPRALSQDTLAEHAKAAGLEGTAYPDVNAALKAALERSSPNDLILVCGSVFVVAEVALF